MYTPQLYTSIVSRVNRYLTSPLSLAYTSLSSNTEECPSLRRPHQSTSLTPKIVGHLSKAGLLGHLSLECEVLANENFQYFFTNLEYLFGLFSKVRAHSKKLSLVRSQRSFWHLKRNIYIFLSSRNIILTYWFKFIVLALAEICSFGYIVANGYGWNNHSCLLSCFKIRYYKCKT